MENDPEFKCPSCDCRHVSVECTVMVHFEDDDDEVHFPVDHLHWDNNSDCVCHACGQRDKVIKFLPPPPPKEKPVGDLAFALAMLRELECFATCPECGSDGEHYEGCKLAALFAKYDQEI